MSCSVEQLGIFYGGSEVIKISACLNCPEKVKFMLSNWLLYLVLISGCACTNPTVDYV